MNDQKLIDDLKFEEGRRFKNGRHVVYRDHLSYFTLGYGRLVDERLGGGLTEEEALYLLRNDIERTTQELRLHSFWNQMNEVRQRALIMMMFQLGRTRFLGFKKMLKALEALDFSRAASEALDSKWALIDTPDRARRVAHMILTGNDPIKNSTGKKETKK